MKKTLFVLSIAALVFASCDKNGENGKLKPLDATLEFEVPSVELVRQFPQLPSQRQPLTRSFSRP